MEKLETESLRKEPTQVLCFTDQYPKYIQEITEGELLRHSICQF
jgi:hypothetical protein